MWTCWRTYLIDSFEPLCNMDSSQVIKISITSLISWKLTYSRIKLQFKLESAVCNDKFQTHLSPGCVETHSCYLTEMSMVKKFSWLFQHLQCKTWLLNYHITGWTKGASCPVQPPIEEMHRPCPGNWQMYNHTLAFQNIIGVRI